jgi:hypothetical protein
LYQVQVGPVTGSKAAEEAARTLKEQENITPKVMKVAEKSTQKSDKKAAKKNPQKTGATAARGAAR